MTAGMGNHVRVSVEADGKQEFARVHDAEGEIEAGGVSFRFKVDDIGESDDSSDDSTTEQSNGSTNEGCIDREPQQHTPTAADPRVASVEDIPTNGTIRCKANGERRSAEVILRRDGEEVFAWQNSCPHQPDVRLDTGGGAIVSDDQIVCPKHGARFECGDGYCTRGPCRGDALEEVAVDVRDGDVYLTDDRFATCRRIRG